MLTYVWDLYFHSILWRPADSQTHRGPFMRRISSPQLLHVALCLFITIVKALACVPHLNRTYTKTFLKGLVGGLWCHDNSSNIIDFFPASETISCFTHLCGEITKETFMTKHIGILAQRSSSVDCCWTLIAVNRKTVMWEIWHHWSFDWWTNGTNDTQYLPSIMGKIRDYFTMASHVVE